VKKKVKIIAEDTDNLATAMNTVMTHMGKFTVALDQLYTEEKGFPFRPEPSRTEILESLNQWHLGVKQSAPLYATLLAKNFSNELQDVGAFLEVLKLRENLVAEQKKAAKKAERWKTAENLPPKQETEKTEDLERERDTTDIVLGVTQLVLGVELQRFWKDRTAAFQSSMTSFAAEQLGIAKQTVGVFEAMSTAT